MKPLDIPFNLSLLQLTPDKLMGLRPVTSLSIFEGATKNFDEAGLFSTIIFGKVGDERRLRRFSFINIKVSIFHPIVYTALTQLKRFYGEILSGKAYAVWNDDIKDFEKSTPLLGKTGFQFFRENWKNIQFENRPSVQREENIRLINMYKEKAMIDKIVVIPAAYRDIEIQASGKISENEMNTLYRKLLSLANTIPESSVTASPEALDLVSNSLQNTYITLYDLFKAMVEGKKNLMMGKWASRKIFNGTRNVITSMNMDSTELGSPGNVGFNDTVVGLYQYLKATLPVSRFQIKSGFLSKVFPGPHSPAVLINKTTLRKETVKLRPEYFDAWMTDEGVEKVITSFGEETVRHKELEIEGYYVGLIYKGPKGEFRIFQDIDEVPDDSYRKHVTPITFCELLYLSVYRFSSKYPAFVTRYPVTGFGSIYPSKTFLKPTVLTEVREELDDRWEPMGKDFTAYQFPLKTDFVNSISPHASKLVGLGADFDGDTASLNVVYSDEAIAEVDKLLSSKKFYVGTDGRIAFSSGTDTVRYLLTNITGTPQ